MRKEKLEYYNLEELWNQEISNSQDDVIKKIMKVLQNIKPNRILDVGCGNGFLINSIPPSIDVIGMDISEEALKHVKKQTVIGNIESIPFEDNAFDVVICTDVIEHLNENTFIKGINELQRVSSKYVILAFPYKENLDYLRCKCSSCGCQFHINWHLHSLDVSRVQKEFKEKYILKGISFGGEEWPTYLTEFEGLKKVLLNNYTIWDKAVCPNCNTRQNTQIHNKYKDEEIVRKQIDKLQVEYLKSNHLYETYNAISKSEAILVFEKKKEKVSNISGLNKSNEQVIFITPDINEKFEINDLNFYDLSTTILTENPFSQKNCIIEVPKEGYIVLSDNSTWGEVENIDGIMARSYLSNNILGEHAVFVFPITRTRLKAITIEYKDMSENPLIVQVYDYNKSYVPIGEIGGENDSRWKKATLNIPEDIKIDLQGYVFDFIAYQGKTVDYYIKSISRNEEEEDSREISLIKSKENQNLLAKNVFDKKVLIIFECKEKIKAIGYRGKNTNIYLDYIQKGDKVYILSEPWIIKDSYIAEELGIHNESMEDNVVGFIDEYFNKIINAKLEVEHLELQDIKRVMKGLPLIIEEESRKQKEFYNEKVNECKHYFEQEIRRQQDEYRKKLEDYQLQYENLYNDNMAAIRVEGQHIEEIKQLNKKMQENNLELERLRNRKLIDYLLGRK